MKPSVLSGVWQTINSRASADFLVQPDHRSSYADLRHAVVQWLAAFDAHGLMAGDRIVVRSTHERAVVSVYIAALLDGVVPVLLSSDSAMRRVSALCSLVEARLCVLDEGPDSAASAQAMPTLALAPGSPSPRRRLFAAREAVQMLPQLPFQPADRLPRLPDDPDGLAYILFTSGTTSAPSGVKISRGSLFANLATLTRVFGYDQHSRVFNDMVLAHADGMVQGPLLAVVNGCAVIRSGGFQLNAMEAWLNRVRSTRASHVITVPTVWSMIDSYACHDDYFDAPECRMLLSVAAKLPEGLWKRLESRFKRPLFNQYGLTETVVSALYAGPHPEMGRIGTIGRPVDCAARLDPAAPTGQPGELQLRGSNVFSGYWRNPERTAASFTDDGWLRTGDLAALEPDGSFRILGRLKTIIMSGGFLIRPDEIDEVMQLHAAVSESVTIGMDDPVFGEVPVTAIVADAPTSEAALTAHARAHLELQKVPKRMVLVDEIPRGDAGKPDLTALKQQLASKLRPLDAEPGVDSGTAATSLADQILAVAAEVFRVPPEALTPRTTPLDVQGWDSFAHLALVLAVEQALEVRIAASRIARLRNLGDLIQAVEDVRA